MAITHFSPINSRIAWWEAADTMPEFSRLFSSARSTRGRPIELNDPAHSEECHS